ncbi:cupredoxin domain-containing protein [Nocardioides montaniterrae]
MNPKLSVAPLTPSQALGRWRSTTLLVLGLVALVIAIAGLAATPKGGGTVFLHNSANTSRLAAKAKASGVTIKIADYKFAPAATSVPVGTTVTWINTDTAPHTVSVSKGPVKFDSGMLNKGQSFSYTFKTVGTYSYYCAVHPDMTATITVTAAAPAPAPTTAPPTHAPTHSPTPAPTPSAPHTATPTPAPTATGSTGMPMPMPAGDCTGLSAVTDRFLAHVYSAHLQESPGQQVSDIASTDRWVKNHTVWIGSMLQPLTEGSQSALDLFLQHVYVAHLQESPGQQVGDILDLDRWLGNHTALIGNMLAPLTGTSSC